MDQLELCVHSLLDDGEQHGTSRLRDRAAETALYLSILAVGAQFADAPLQSREAQSQNLGGSYLLFPRPTALSSKSTS
jgi:hypothetical protein